VLLYRDGGATHVDNGVLLCKAITRGSIPGPDGSACRTASRTSADRDTTNGRT
jgi:hypothetical protein